MTNIPSTLADRLREARQHAGFETAAAAAAALGIADKTYQGHENGHRGVPLDKLQHYARRFKVTYSWLIDGEWVDRRVKMRRPPSAKADAIDGVDGDMIRALVDQSVQDAVADLLGRSARSFSSLVIPPDRDQILRSLGFLGPDVVPGQPLRQEQVDLLLSRHGITVPWLATGDERNIPENTLILLRSAATVSDEKS